MKILQKTFNGLWVSAILFLGSANLAMGATGTGGKIDPVDPRGAGAGSLVTFITETLKIVIGLAGLVAAAVLIFNGFKYMTAQGDEKKIKDATTGITYAIIGLVIAAISFMIVNFVVGQIGGVDATPKS